MYRGPGYKSLQDTRPTCRILGFPSFDNDFLALNGPAQLKWLDVDPGMLRTTAGLVQEGYSRVERRYNVALEEVRKG